MAPTSTTGILRTEKVNGIEYNYQTGFGNELQSELIEGALPIGRNNPRQVAYNLYTEQLSGSAFTAPRALNHRTWLYRIQPSVACEARSSTDNPPTAVVCPNIRLDCHFGGICPSDCLPVVDPCRWKSNQSHAGDGKTFVNGMRLHAAAGDHHAGVRVYQYAFTRSMGDQHFVNADGDFLFVPCEGSMLVTTEFGRLTIQSGEIVVIPRGIVFDVAPTGVLGSCCRGYVLEICSHRTFELPELGPVGSNGLANARDFLFPVAFCVDKSRYYERTRIVTKLEGELFERSIDHSPYNVVAWHGNYLPYKYNLRHFCAAGSITYDHLDPSIYTVLTCPYGNGTALADFVIFPPRTMATDSNTLRPPWFHRNCMSEYMGLISGNYDAKQDFVPGGASLHNRMTPHGPDAKAYAAAVADPCDTPARFEGGLAFMFETCLTLRVTQEALEDPGWRDKEYAACWQELGADKFTGWDQMTNDREVTRS